MKAKSMALMMLLGIGSAVVNASAVSSEPTPSPMSADKPVAEAEPDAVAEADPDKARGFKLPAGFKEKKRGKFVLYCKRDAPMGTRVKTETCLDEAQMRDYLLALETNKVDIDRVRAVCSNPCVCGQPC
ncbi:MAG: hypothetical protein AB7P44_09560 [Steroidobacteraceae bacterium]